MESNALLNRHMMNRAVFDTIGKKKRPIQGGKETMGFPPGYGKPMAGMMTSTLPSAGETSAFNDRVNDRAMMGKYGQGGLAREKLAQQAMATMLTSANDRAKMERERIDKHLDRENELEKARINKSGGALGLPQEGGILNTPSAMTANPTNAPISQQGGGALYGGRAFPPPPDDTPQGATPRISGSDSQFMDKNGFPLSNTSFSNMPSGTGTMTVSKGVGGKTNMFGRKIGKAGTYALNRQGQSKYTPFETSNPIRSPEKMIDPRGNSAGSKGVSTPFQGGKPGEKGKKDSGDDFSKPKKKKVTPGSRTPQVSLKPKGQQPRHIAAKSVGPSIDRAGRTQDEHAKWLLAQMKKVLGMFKFSGNKVLEEE